MVSHGIWKGKDKRRNYAGMNYGLKRCFQNWYALPGTSICMHVCMHMYIYIYQGLKYRSKYIYIYTHEGLKYRSTLGPVQIRTKLDRIRRRNGGTSSPLSSSYEADSIVCTELIAPDLYYRCTNTNAMLFFVWVSYWIVIEVVMIDHKMDKIFSFFTVSLL